VSIRPKKYARCTPDKETGEVINTQLKRAQFLQWFANRAPSDGRLACRAQQRNPTAGGVSGGFWAVIICAIAAKKEELMRNPAIY
jgi:hypothetical protein